MAETPVPATLADVPRERWPQHIAIIMDGNGRWARQRRLPRMEGHRAGRDSVERVLEVVEDLGLKQVTLYAFSHENWSRPQDEIDSLMKLYRRNLVAERRRITEKNARFINIGRRDKLPAAVLKEVETNERLGAENTGPVLCLAVNYGGRQEIVDAARSLARDAAAGTLDPETIDEATFASRLYTAGQSDPDLLIRTGGEMRVSNFLLWQISYTELYVTDVLWPDFQKEDLYRAMADYARRQRRFGGLSPDDVR
ncbi:MAG: isoprenyl transferase [Phycisphaerae bacterium]|nr:isoprenyl transferase [Phycisphaerae bacterium]